MIFLGWWAQESANLRARTSLSWQNIQYELFGGRLEPAGSSLQVLSARVNFLGQLFHRVSIAYQRSVREEAVFNHLMTNLDG